MWRWRSEPKAMAWAHAQAWEYDTKTSDWRVLAPSAGGEAIAAAKPLEPAGLVLVDDADVCHWVMAPVHGARDVRELDLAARHQAATLFGGTSADWSVAGDWRAEAATFCVALPSALRLRAEAMGGRTCRVVSLWTRLMEELAPVAPTDGWLIVDAGAQAVCTRWSSGRIVGWERWTLPSQGEASEVLLRVATLITQWVAREALPNHSSGRWLGTSRVPAKAALQSALGMDWDCLDWPGSSPREPRLAASLMRRLYGEGAA